MSLRRRIAGANWDSLKSFDVYSKIQDDYAMRTKSGATVTVITFFILTLLFLSELSSYLHVEVVDHIFVDTTLNQKLHIGLNITFPQLRCSDISVDTVDSTGDNQVDIHAGLTKTSLDANLKPSKGKFVPVPGKCYPCHEATTEKHPCCNSCSELKTAYNDVDKHLPWEILSTTEQCQYSVGCEVEGNVKVSKVGGNVHIALGRSTIRDGKHRHEVELDDINEGFNTSHTINQLEFGGSAPGVESPLTGSTKIVKYGSFMFHYYVKLVPTNFVSLSGEKISTHQYAVTDNAKNVMVKRGELSGLPGVFLVYEFNPFMVEKREKRIPFTHFITSVCAILGGVFTVASVINSLIQLGIFKLFGCQGNGGSSKGGDMANPVEGKDITI